MKCLLYELTHKNTKLKTDWKNQNGEIIPMKRREFIKRVHGCRRCLINPAVMEGKGKNSSYLCEDCELRESCNGQVVVRLKIKLEEIITFGGDGKNINKIIDNICKQNKRSGKTKKNYKKNEYGTYLPEISTNNGKKSGSGHINLNSLHFFYVSKNVSILKDFVESLSLQTIAMLVYEHLQQAGIQDCFIKHNIYSNECTQWFSCPRGDMCSYCHSSFDFEFGAAIRYLRDNFEIIRRKIEIENKRFKKQRMFGICDFVESFQFGNLFVCLVVHVFLPVCNLKLLFFCVVLLFFCE